MSKILLSLPLVYVALMSTVEAKEIRGHYMESRTCQVYTGPCFANAETGLAGKNAVMAWNITDGQHEGVDLAGLSVVVAVDSTETLGFGGLRDGKQLRSLVLVDEDATPSQQKALLSFAKKHTGPAGKNVVRVAAAPIDMSLDTLKLNGKLKVGNAIKLETRKAGRGDCICSNEAAYYPPLAKVEHFAPGVTTVGEVKARGLGTRWTSPGDRSAYMATFVY